MGLFLNVSHTEVVSSVDEGGFRLTVLDGDGEIASADTFPVTFVGDGYVLADGPESITFASGRTWDLTRKFHLSGGAGEELFLGSPGNDWITTGAGADTVRGHGGDDNITGGPGEDVLHGGAGDDRYRIRDLASTVVEEADGGTDTIWVRHSYRLPDHVENLVLDSSVNWKVARGNDLDNVIETVDGTQALQGGRGDDTLIGGAGADTFSFEAGDGHDVVRDFEPGSDRITLWDPALARHDDLRSRMSEIDGATLVAVSPGQSILLQGVALADLDAADFGFADPLPDDLVLTFAQEFDDFDPVADPAWRTDYAKGHETALQRRGLGGGREQIYVDRDYAGLGSEPLGLDPFRVEDGILTITAERAPEDLVDELHGRTWTSGLVSTQHGFSQTYGYFEMRAKLPAGQGFWPAFWLLPEDYGWPPEIDVFDDASADPQTYRAGTISSVWGFTVASARNVLVPDTSAGFHDFAVLWTPQTLTYFFDGRKIHETATPALMHDDMFILANLAVGGRWAGPTDDTTPPVGEFEIDHIRVYQSESLASLPRADGLTDVVDRQDGVLRKGVRAPVVLYGDDPVRLAEGETDGALPAPGGAGEPFAVVGNARANTLTGNAVPNTVNGKDGDDTLAGLGGRDTLIGEAGDDVLAGGPHGDHLAGGAGDDRYVVARADLDDEAPFEIVHERLHEGVDTIAFVDLAPSDVRMWIDWARLHVEVPAADGGAGRLLVRLVVTDAGHEIGETVEFITFADGTVWDLRDGVRLRDSDEAHDSAGTSGADTIHGNGGADRLIGMDGDDAIDGGAGADTIHGGAGDDTLTGGPGRDVLHGEAGDDRVSAGADGGTLTGGDGEDTLEGSKAADVADGAGGADRVRGHGGDDLLTGGDGDDWLTGDRGTDSLHGGAGDDTLRIDAADTVFDGGKGEDRLYVLGDAGAVIAVGAAGLEEVFGSDQDDVIDGRGAPAALFIGGRRGDDALFGGKTDSVLYGHGGDDTLHAGTGPTVLVGGPGADTFAFAAPWGAATIRHFDLAEGDRLDFSDSARVEGWEDLALHAGARTLTIARGDSIVRLSDVTVEELLASDAAVF